MDKVLYITAIIARAVARLNAREDTEQIREQIKMTGLLICLEIGDMLSDKKEAEDERVSGEDQNHAA